MDKLEQYDWNAKKNLNGSNIEHGKYMDGRQFKCYLRSAVNQEGANGGRLINSYPSKFFSALQSYCPRISVALLSYDSRSTILRLDRRNKFGRDML